MNAQKCLVIFFGSDIVNIVWDMVELSNLVISGCIGFIIGSIISYIHDIYKNKKQENWDKYGLS